MNGTHDSKAEGHDNGDPLITTPSANRTLDGFDFNFAFLAAVSKADFLVDCINERLEC